MHQASDNNLFIWIIVQGKTSPAVEQDIHFTKERAWSQHSIGLILIYHAISESHFFNLCTTTAGKIILRVACHSTDNMNRIAIEKFVSNLADYHELTLKQQQNIQKLNILSKIFFSRAKIDEDDTPNTGGRTIVLESGHQPNFFPYSGIWKKAFLLSWFQKQLEGKGKNAIAYFGFADQNLSTAKILTKNHIPYWNKKGMEEVGFNIEEKERFFPFCCVNKPSRERWEKEIDKIGGLRTKQINQCRMKVLKRNKKSTKLFQFCGIVMNIHRISQS